MPETFRETLVLHVCSRIHVIVIIFSISLLFFLLSVGSFVIVSRQSMTFVIVVFNLIGLGVFTVLSGAAILACRNREYQ